MLYFGCLCCDAQTLVGTLSTGDAIEVTGYKNKTTALNSKDNMDELRATLAAHDAKDDYEMGMHFMNGKGGKMETLDLEFNKKENGEHYFSVFGAFKTPVDTRKLLQASRKAPTKTRAAPKAKPY
jgi:hypothetical protein